MARERTTLDDLFSEIAEETDVTIIQHGGIKEARKGEWLLRYIENRETGYAQLEAMQIYEGNPDPDNNAFDENGIKIEVKKKGEAPALEVTIHLPTDAEGPYQNLYRSRIDMHVEKQNRKLTGIRDALKRETYFFGCIPEADIADVKELIYVLFDIKHV